MRRFSWLACWFVAMATPVVSSAAAAARDPVARFEREIRPILERRCFDCHGEGSNRGGVALDDRPAELAAADEGLWMRVLKVVRLGLMPPASEGPLAPEDLEALTHWIKRDAFALDPVRPDPGRGPIRRLNQGEYRNTIRDLMGIDFEASKAFPADDTGHGFDNIADVLTVSPMLLEKYLDAAQAIVARAVPLQARVVREVKIEGERFMGLLPETGAPGAPGSVDLSYYEPGDVRFVQRIKEPGSYQVVMKVRTAETYSEDADLNHCRVRFSIDGRVVWERELGREDGHPVTAIFNEDWGEGAHELALEVVPLPPARERVRRLRIRLDQVLVRGPLESRHWVQPEAYERFFPRPVPRAPGARRRYARALLSRFATRAFRRPVEAESVERLVRLAETVSVASGGSFEAGVAQAMAAVLASPRFIFREERTLPLRRGDQHPLVDEYTLASRLSYFLWSSMPDERLFRLAHQGRLRGRLPQEFDRMLRDPRAGAFVQNFAGQWLQSRDMGKVEIDPLAVYLREHPDPEVEAAREVFRRLGPIAREDRTPSQSEALRGARETFHRVSTIPKPELTRGLREAMRQETELGFAHLIQENRSLLELIDCDYAFLNEELAAHYGIPGVKGPAMRKVVLPPDSPRGGVLTQGTVLTVTSNPTRTSPVKRGVFILNAILGTPPAPPPPNIPSLEDVASREQLQKMSLRQALDLHASNALCRSCHNRMDPLGLALENFSALGRWRDSDMNLPVEPGGTLVTGERFSDVRELKRVLAKDRRKDFYHNVAEKLLTYALGRGLEASDVDTHEALVAVLEREGGKPQPLLRAIVASAPFQRMRRAPSSLNSPRLEATR